MEPDTVSGWCQTWVEFLDTLLVSGNCLVALCVGEFPPPMLELGPGTQKELVLGEIDLDSL